MPAPGRQAQAQAPSAEAKRQRDRKARRKARLLSKRSSTRTAGNFSAEKIAEIASRVSFTGSRDVISAPVNLRESMERAAAAESAQAYRDNLANNALNAAKSALDRANSTASVIGAVQQQSKQQMANLGISMGAMAQEVTAALRSGAFNNNERLNAAQEGFAQTTAQLNDDVQGNSAGILESARSTNAQLKEVVGAATAATAAATREGAAEAMAKFNKAMASLSEISTRMNQAFSALKSLAGATKELLNAAYTEVSNCIQDMADSIPHCEGEKKIKMYFCPVHTVYAEKTRAAENQPNSCTFKQDKYETTENIVKYEPGGPNGEIIGQHYRWKGTDENGKKVDMSWPSLCCEREFTAFDEGWRSSERGAKPSASTVRPPGGKLYNIVEYPMRLAYGMAHNKVFSWGQLVFNEARQVTANRKYMKEEREQIVKVFDGDEDGIAKIYFLSKNTLSRDQLVREARDSKEEGEALQEELIQLEWQGGAEECNDYTAPIVSADSKSIIEALSALIHHLVKREIIKSRNPNYCKA